MSRRSPDNHSSGAGGETAEAPRFVLASASPRRRELLHQAGYDFHLHPADIDEDDHPQKLLPGDLAEWLATQKAEVISARFPASAVLGADTIVAFGDAILGKPHDADHARQMLRLLGGSTHLVVTGIAVRRRRDDFKRSARVMSAVKMRELTDEEIERYVATLDWQGKAGGYGIQDNDPFVTRITGSFTNIVGLPMDETAAMLAEAGVIATLLVSS
ncbi:MAG TPA: Maf family protein [Tepidisphaeraceae bacterium]|jgi:septum formation protein|nr:Maf family protein [Tepidisphaeraceae bacterium]